jgi:cytidylate kinase
MNQRDAQDAGREIAPATAAPDAILLDNTGLSFDESVDAIIDLARKTGRI